MRVRIVLVRLHDLRSSIAHCCGLATRSLKPRSNQTVALNDASSLLLFRTLLEEHLTKHVLLLPKTVIILHVVVVRLVKHAIRIMVAVWVLIADPSDLSQLNVRGRALIRVLLEWHCIWVVTGLPWARSTLLSEILAGQQ